MDSHLQQAAMGLLLHRFPPHSRQGDRLIRLQYPKLNLTKISSQPTNPISRLKPQPTSLYPLSSPHKIPQYSTIQDDYLGSQFFQSKKWLELSRDSHQPLFGKSETWSDQEASESCIGGAKWFHFEHDSSRQVTLKSKHVSYHSPMTTFAMKCPLTDLHFDLVYDVWAKFAGVFLELESISMPRKKAKTVLMMSPISMSITPTCLRYYSK